MAVVVFIVLVTVDDVFVIVVSVAVVVTTVLLAIFFVEISLDEMMSLLSLPRDYRLSRAERGLP